MSLSNQVDTTTVILGAIIFLLLLTMGMGFGGMMGGYGTTSGWWRVVGMLVQLVFPFLLLGGGYLVFRRVTESQSSRNPAVEELRMAYARGDLTEEEFETRRNKLERSE